jgi:hypothetical protein
MHQFLRFRLETKSARNNGAESPDISKLLLRVRRDSTPNRSYTLIVLVDVLVVAETSYSTACLILH